MIRFLRYLYTNVNILNLAILASVIAIIVFAVIPLFRMGAKFTLPQVKPKPVAEVAAPAEKTPAPSPVDYAMIGENNLFHPERKIPPLKTDEQALPRPDLVLYGTIIADGATIAYIEDRKSPKTTPGRGNRQTAVKKGDILSGFVVREIEADKIVLLRGDETMVVQLSQEKKGRGGGVPGAPGTSPPGSSVTQPGRQTAPARPAAQPTFPPRPAPTSAQPVAPPPIVGQGALPGSQSPQKLPTRSRRDGLMGQ